METEEGVFLRGKGEAGSGGEEVALFRDRGDEAEAAGAVGAGHWAHTHKRPRIRKQAMAAQNEPSQTV